MFPGTHARTTPEKAAIVVAETGDVVTYARLDERSTRLARVFREAGLHPGDHVAFLSDNRPEVFEVYWAALRSGLYVTGVNHHLVPDEAAYVVEDCGARVLVAAPSVAGLAVAVAGRVPELELRLALGGGGNGDGDGDGDGIEGYGSYEDALGAVSAGPLGDQPCGADMLYSSGTTGRPKGVQPALPPRQVDEPGDTVAGVFGPLYGFGPDTVYYSPAPVYHAAPLRFGGMVHRYGGTLVLAHRFDAEAALAAIQRYRVTHGQFVPTMFVRMLKLPPEVRNSYDVSSLRVAVHAAAPCPVEVKRQMMDWWGPVLHEYYSSTEANGVTLIGPEQWLERPGSVGKAGLGVIHVCDDEGRELPAGEVGTIWFERDEMPFAYHGDPARTTQAQHPAHPTWSTVGDIGRVDDEGFLFLTDRKAFTVISGGTNVYPQEVEDVLTLHPAVHDVAVIGVPDPDMGEVVKAVVQLPGGVEGGPALEQELIDFVRSRIAHYKAPRTVDFVAELPRTPTGKLRKHELKARYTAVAG